MEKINNEIIDVCIDYLSSLYGKIFSWNITNITKTNLVCIVFVLKDSIFEISLWNFQNCHIFSKNHFKNEIFLLKLLNIHMNLINNLWVKLYFKIKVSTIRKMQGKKTFWKCHLFEHPISKKIFNIMMIWRLN